MMNNEKQYEKIKQLEEQVETLRKENWELKTGQRDRFARNLVYIGGALISAILFLIYVALDMRYKLEYVRLSPEQQAAVSAVPGVAHADGAAKGPKQPSTLPPVGEQASDAQRKLDDYIDREAARSKGGNSYSVTLGGLGELINGMVKTGQIAADKGTALMQELGKSAITATGDILKESAKAIIARYLGPESEKEPKATAGAPTQQVLVNVYGSEKQVVASQPKKTPQPARPKPSCPVPAPVPDTKPASCSPS